MKGWGDDLEKLTDVNHNIKILNYIPDKDLPYYFVAQKFSYMLHIMKVLDCQF